MSSSRLRQIRRYVENVLRLNGGDVDDYNADGKNIMSSRHILDVSAHFLATMLQGSRKTGKAWKI